MKPKRKSELFRGNPELRPSHHGKSDAPAVGGKGSKQVFALRAGKNRPCPAGHNGPKNAGAGTAAPKLAHVAPQQQNKPLKLLIVDDHELIRRGLRAVLSDQPGWQVVGEAANGREAVELARQLRPDVIVLDLIMPVLNGLEATRRIRKAVPEAEVLILSMHESERLVGEALSAGARGYILKADTSRLLVSAIEALSRHKPFFTGEIAQVMLSWYLKAGQSLSRPKPPHIRLTAREREIVQLLAEGWTNKEVATTLNISLKTVDAHRSNLMHKLNLKSVTDLVRYAIRNQIIQA